MIRLFEMFAGYGGASFALVKANIPFECVGYSEIDKYAIQCYEQNHKGKNYGDCTKINTDKLPDFDLLTGGFPCQDVSIAGKRDLNQGRTNLYSEILRIASAKKPKYMLLENVEGLLSMGKTDRIDNNPLISIIIRDLKKIGYQVCWKLLNSKDFGIPQSRSRVWIVCFRDDIYEPFKFQYPEGEKLTIFIKDILETEVDSKYYLSEKLQERFSKYLQDKNKENIIITGQQEHQQIKIDGISNSSKREMGFKEEISPTLLSRDYKDPKIVIQPNVIGKVNEGQAGTVYNTNGVINSQHATQHGNDLPIINSSSRLRRLTPKECFRLMGFFKDEINLQGLSDTQQYKLAGNGWALRPATDIFKRMFR